MNIYICDDDREFILELEDWLRPKLFTDDSITCYTNGRSLLKDLKKMSADIVFLDIEMPGMWGIDLCEEIHSIDNSILVVFVNVHRDKVLPPCEAGRGQYIVKPIRQLQMNRIFQEARELAQLLNQDFGHFVVSNRQGISFIKQKKILYVEAWLHKKLVVTTAKIHSCSKKMTELLTALDNRLFLRVHRSYIINLGYVSGFDAVNQEVIMRNDKRIPVSDRYLGNLKKRMLPIVEGEKRR